MSNKISKKILREFGFLLSFAFPIIIGWFLPYLSGHSFRTWTLLISIPLLIFAMAAPSLLLYPYKIWMKFGYFLGWFNSRIILGIIFILVLQPIALIMKTFGYDPLRKKKTKDVSYKENRKNHKVDFTRIF